MHHNESHEVEFNLDGVDYEVDMEVTISRDFFYGADTDGKRGEIRDFISNVRVIGVFTYDSCDDCTEIKSHEPIYQILIDEAIKKLMKGKKQ